MKRQIVILCACLLGYAGVLKAQTNDVFENLTGRYWVYDNSVWDNNGKSVHTFLERVNEGQVLAKGTGFYLDDRGTFQEVADEKKIGGKPCSGTWTKENANTMKVICGGKVWHYKIVQHKEGTLLLMVDGEFNKAKSKAPAKKPKKK